MQPFKLYFNITTIQSPKYYLQLVFDIIYTDIVYVNPENPQLVCPLYDPSNIYYINGKDYNIYLPDEIDKIDFNYNFDDKLVIPGIWNLSIFDDYSMLNEWLLEQNFSVFALSVLLKIDLTKPISANLYHIKDHEKFVFPLEDNHTAFFSGYIYTKSLAFDDFTKLFSLSVQPNIELLKKADVRGLKAVRADALEIPDAFLSMKENLYYLLQVAFPNLKQSDIAIEHEFVFCAHSNPAHSHTSSDPNTIFAAGSIGVYTIHDLLFNVRDIVQRLGSITYPGNELRSMSVHDLLKVLCFSFFATLTVSHNRVIFASINKSFRTDKTFNGNRKVFSFTTETNFERLEWIRVTEVSANSHLSYTIGTQSDTTNGFDKNIALVTIMNFAVNQGVTRYILSSPFKVMDAENKLLHVIFAKESSTATDYKTFRKLLAKLWYNYLNIYSSGKIYHFLVDSVDFDFTQSIGYHDRLYSPVGIHYDIVDDSTTIDAVRI